MRATAQRLEFIQNYLASSFGSDLHVERVCSLSPAALGVMTSASLAVAVIGQALAQGARQSGRACNQAGLPPVEQPRHRRLGVVPALDQGDDRL